MEGDAEDITVSVWLNGNLVPERMPAISYEFTDYGYLKVERDKQTQRFFNLKRVDRFEIDDPNP